jgi:hypothetical protein
LGGEEEALLFPLTTLLGAGGFSGVVLVDVVVVVSVSLVVVRLGVLGPGVTTLLGAGGFSGVVLVDIVVVVSVSLVVMRLFDF